MTGYTFHSNTNQKAYELEHVNIISWISFFLLQVNFEKKLFTMQCLANIGAFKHKNLHMLLQSTRTCTNEKMPSFAINYLSNLLNYFLFCPIWTCLFHSPRNRMKHVCERWRWGYHQCSATACQTSYPLLWCCRSICC